MLWRGGDKGKAKREGSLFTSLSGQGLVLKEAGLCCLTMGRSTVHVECGTNHDWIDCQLLWRFDFDETRDFRWKHSPAWSRWSEAHYCEPPYHLDFISEQEDFQGNKKPQSPDNQGEIAQCSFGCQLGHLALIWFLFNPHKKKNQQGFGLILLALCFLSPCRLEDKCERRHSDLPTEPCPAPPQHILIVKWIARASWWLVPSACQVRDRARGPSQVSQWDYLFPAVSWSVYFSTHFPTLLLSLLIFFFSYRNDF